MTTQAFDLYSRNRIVKEIIDKTIRNKADKLSIIDLGGYRGDIEMFFDKDNVVVLDVYDVKNKPNYVKGDATNLSFKDDSFEVSTSFDVLEHIPRRLRRAFIKESIRVAKKIALMTFPQDSGDGRVMRAETELNEYHKILTGKDHPWLEEHISFGIPKESEIEKILDTMGYKYYKISSNNLNLWKLLQIINFTTTVSVEAIKVANELNDLYEKNIETLEADIPNGYRAIYIIAKESEIEKKLEKLVNSGIFLQKENFKALSTEDFTSIVQHRINNLIASLISTSNQEINLLNKRITELENERKLIINSKSWEITKPLRVAKEFFSSKKNYNDKNHS